MKMVKVVLSPDAEEVYRYLQLQSPVSKRERMLLNAINKKIAVIKSNYHYGKPLAKRLIPKEYISKYGVTNLFRIELPLFWRMLYTLVDGEDEIQIIAFILGILNHKTYDKLMRYK